VRQVGYLQGSRVKKEVQVEGAEVNLKRIKSQ